MPGMKLATAYYELIPSMGGNQAAITSQMGAAGAASSKSFSSKFSSGLSTTLKTIGITSAAAAAVGFIKGSVAEGREAQKVGALTASIIKSTGGVANVTAKSVSSLAGAISAKTGIDDEAIQTGANLLLTFKNVQNQAGKGNKIFDQATAAAVDLSAAGFGSVDSASKQLGKALNDPIKGVSALGKAGVTFTEGQKEQIAAMVKGGNVLGAQKIILGEVKSQVGGAAAAQATAGDKMSVAWGNLQETIGTALIPALDKLFAGLAKVMNFISSHQSVMIAIGVIIGVALVAALVAATAAVWSFTVALLANPITWIVIAILLFVAAIAAVIVGIVMLVKAIIRNWDTIKAKTAAVWSAITAWLGKAWGAIKEKAAAAWDAIKTKVSTAWAAIKAAVTTKATELLTFIKGLPAKMGAFFSALPGKLKEIGTNIVLGLRDGIVGAWHWVTDKVEALIAKIPLAIRKLLHIASPSKVMVEIGGHIAEGLALGMDQGRPRVATSAHALAGRAIGPVVANRPAAAASRAAGSRPIHMPDGTLFGWISEIADGRTELHLNRQAISVGIGS